MKEHELFQRMMLVSILMFATAIVLAGQQSVRCPSKDKTKTMYRLGISDRSAEGPPTLLLQISVKPKRFNREDMMRVAQQIRDNFCHEQRIHVALFDDEREASSTALIYGYLTQQGETGALRGFYDLDREKGTEAIKFNTKRNNPLDEVVLDFSS